MRLNNRKWCFYSFLFCFKQHSSSTSSNFNSWILDDEYYSLTFVFFYLCIVIIMHILIDLFYCVDLFIERSNQSVFLAYHFWTFRFDHTDFGVRWNHVLEPGRTFSKKLRKNKKSNFFQKPFRQFWLRW